MKNLKITREITDRVWRSVNADNYLLNIIIGPRQVGKTTAVCDIADRWKGEAHYVSADLSSNYGSEWIRVQWDYIRQKKGEKKKLLILDEIQKIDGWSETVKALWDEDRRNSVSLKVILLGSSSLLLSQGCSESLAGRFLLHRFTYWTYQECIDAFGVSLEEWIFFGGYPGAYQFIENIDLWKQYIIDSLIDTVLTRDILSIQTVTKPALLRALFFVALFSPSQIISYNKILGQLQDAGNTTTLAHYLKLLESAFLVCGLEKYSGSIIRTKSSSPKLVIWNNALINAVMPYKFSDVRQDFTRWGRLVENVVLAHIVNNLQSINYKVEYWRERNLEVDCVVSSGTKIWAIEVKSGVAKNIKGLTSFCRKYPNATPILIGPGGIPFEEFFKKKPQEYFI